MALQLELDETEQLDEVLSRFSNLCTKFSVSEAAAATGKATIASFLHRLGENAAIGNKARFERSIADGQNVIRIVAIHSSQRRGIKALILRILSR